MIIDFHIHVTRPEHAHPWVMKFIQEDYEGDIFALVDKFLTPSGIRTLLQQAEIDYAIALAEVCPVTTGSCTNEYIIDFVDQANALTDPPSGPKGRLIPFASPNPYIDSDLSQRLEELVVEQGVRGVKLYPVYQLHYANDTRIYPLYAKAQELGIPVLVHTGSSMFRGARIKYGDPLHLDDVAIDFPDLNLIMAHSGRPFWFQQAFWMARRHPNVYMEVSGLPAKNLLTYFPKLETLADKVIYGSDWPGNAHIERNLQAIRELPLREESKAKILGGNAAQLLGLGVQPDSNQSPERDA
jgi:hypothetical protein